MSLIKKIILINPNPFINSSEKPNQSLVKLGIKLKSIIGTTSKVEFSNIGSIKTDKSILLLGDDQDYIYIASTLVPLLGINWLPKCESLNIDRDINIDPIISDIKEHDNYEYVIIIADAKINRALSEYYTSEKNIILPNADCFSMIYGIILDFKNEDLDFISYIRIPRESFKNIKPEPIK